MSAYIAEFLGTLFLVLLGDGVVATVSLNKSGFKGGGTTHILMGWGTAVLLPAYAFGAVSGSHFNPAVTIGAAVRGAFDWNLVPGYIISQMLGGFCGAIIVYILYKAHFDATEEVATKRGVFCTAPSIKNQVLNFLSEFVATFCLVFFLAAIPGTAAESAVSWGLVYAVIVACGASFGGLTGYAMNAARDTAPRIAYMVLPIKGEKDADWSYGWIPAVAPILGGICAS
ncbi:MAG: aquaporin family protein, partial [Butyrivibrio sp.]|nr:aquaporin family protein [Butyrivibrio sp.]